MIFIFDTNVLISACLKPDSTPAKALLHAQTIGKIAFSELTLFELKDVLNRPFFRKYLKKGQYDLILSTITDNCILTKTHPDLSIKCQDESDIKFLELAVTVMADCIISGDKDLLIIHPFEGIPILTANTFLKTF